MGVRLAQNLQMLQLHCALLHHLHRSTSTGQDRERVDVNRCKQQVQLLATQQGSMMNIPIKILFNAFQE